MKKNLVKKSILPALAALVCSVIALTSVSYAWFTTGNQAKVEGVQMNVNAADGLQISATGNASDFRSNLSTALLQAVVDESNKPLNNFPAGEVAPVSTVPTVTGGQMTFYLGTITDGVLSATADSSKANVIYFDIYVKTSAKRDLLLEGTSTVEAVAYKGSTKETYLASRVAFFYIGCEGTASGAQDLTAGNGNAVVWEPNSKTRSQAALNAGKENNKALSYEGIHTAGTYKEENGATVTTYDFASTTDTITICEMQAGYNRIRVFIWLEGQDVDCLNEVSGGAFKVNLHLAQGDVK